MAAVIITFPISSRRPRVEQDRAGSNPLVRAIDKARAIAAGIASCLPGATLAAELEELAGLVCRLERSHPLRVDDEAFILFGSGMIHWPLRGVPEMLAGLMAA